MSRTTKQHSVVITGLGIVSPIGLNEEEVWKSLIEGKSGVDQLTGFDLEGNKITHGAQVDVSQLDSLQRGRLRKSDRSVRFAVEAARQALVQAELIPADNSAKPPEAGMDIATLWGCGCGPCETLYNLHRRLNEKGPQGMRPTSVPNSMANNVSASVSIQFKLTGTNQVIVTACTSSTNAIGQGLRMIRHGYADKVLCGGVDAPFDPYYFGAWNNLGVFSDIDDPAKAVKPFDKNRRGTLLGEGAAVLLLESETSAVARNAKIKGRLLGYGETSDATHITSPSIEGQVMAMRLALDDAGLGPGMYEQLAFINAHGTATPANDSTESASIRSVLGDAANGVPVVAHKSSFGHSLGASGAIESVAALLSLENETLPPNLNLDDPDPDCPVHLAGSTIQPLEPEKPFAMKNSFGFGGGNGVLIFGRADSGLDQS